jgi:hypothetical protein
MEGMEKQLTAVEWLLENLITEPYSEADFEHNSDCWDKAKQMEKGQIMKTWYDCKLSIIERNPTDAKQYYNKTFKSE